MNILIYLNFDAFIWFNFISSEENSLPDTQLQRVHIEEASVFVATPVGRHNHCII